MLVSVNWLKKYIDIKVDIKTLIDLIGSRLVEVEEVIDLKAKFEPVLIAKVIKSEKIDGSDHLSLIKIDDGGVTGDKWRDQDGLIQVVCGAPNMRAGLVVAWLPPDSIVPNTFDRGEQFKLAVRKVYGYTSHGMIASGKELDLSDQSDGILELEQQFKPGTSFVQAFELDDYLIDIENKSLTHRPDCFGMIGFAREIAGILNQPFASPAWFTQEHNLIIKKSLKLRPEIKQADLASSLVLAVIDDAQNFEGLSFLQKTYLARVGIRSVDPIVDISNFVMLEIGQPTHAYDYDKLKRIAENQKLGQITIAVEAGKTSKLKLLDGKEIQLSKDDAIISVGQQVIGLAGIMGGESTRIDQSTKTIVLESASFNLYKMRTSQMRHGIFSEAITRFTKGQPPALTTLAVQRIFELINLPTKDYSVMVVKAKPKKNNPIVIDYSLINCYLGTNLNQKNIIILLKNVQLQVKADGDNLIIEQPWWRTDINRRVDIIEEVGRLNGYDNIKLDLPTQKIQTNQLNAQQELARNITNILVRAGANEVLTYNFVPGKTIELSGQKTTDSYQIINSLSPELEYYRQTIVPNLLNKVKPNLQAGFDKFALFEQGKTHFKPNGLNKEHVPVERNSLGFVLVDKNNQNDAYYFAKYYADFLFRQLRMEVKYRSIDDLTYDNAIFEPKRAAQMVINQQVIGYVGEFKTTTIKEFKLPSFVAGFEIDLNNLLNQFQPNQWRLKASQNLPTTSRDICFEVGQALPYEELANEILQAVKSFNQIDFLVIPVDFYADNEELKRITIRLIFKPKLKTLTAEQVESLVKVILKQVSKQIEFRII